MKKSLIFALLLGVGTFSFASPSLIYFGEIGCAHCDTFFSKDIPAAEALLGIRVDTQAVDILSASGFERCEKELTKRGLSFTHFPVLLIGNNAYQGNTAIDANLTVELAYYATHGEYLPLNHVDDEKSSDVFTLAIIPVILAGLIDGINPCAFATMLFFMSWITLRGGGRKKLALTALAFISGVFAAYFAIGIGFISALGILSELSSLRFILRVFFALCAVSFSVISLLDAVRASRGMSGSMTLQLPTGVKNLMHRVIRARPVGEGRFSASVFIGFFVTGLTVAILELACTGQVYLPTIAYMVQSISSAARYKGLAWLLLYNIAFILPLGAVFALCLAGVSLERIRAFFTRNLVFAKLSIAVLFAILAALIWFV